MLGGIFLFTLASVLCGFAPTLGLLLAARVAQGVGAAAMVALTIALVTETVPKSKTGSAMGLLGTMSAVGTALGPSLSGVLIAGFSWRAIFWVNLLLGILAFLPAQRYLPADCRVPKADRAHFDPIGTLLLALTLAAYALAMTVGRGHYGALNMALLLLAAVIGPGLFVVSQAKVASPLVRLAALRDPALGASLSRNLGLITGASVMGAVFALAAGTIDTTTAAPDIRRCGNAAGRGPRHRHGKLPHG